MKKILLMTLAFIAITLPTSAIEASRTESILVDSKVGDVTGNGINKTVEMRVEVDSELYREYGGLFGDITLSVKDFSGNLIKAILVEEGQQAEKLYLKDFTGDGKLEMITIIDAGGRYISWTQLFLYDHGKINIPSWQQADLTTKHHFDVKQIITSGRTLVHVRFIFESFGADVDWEPDEQSSGGGTVVIKSKQT